MIKLFYPIHAYGEPTGSQLARPAEDSGPLWAQKRRSMRKPMEALQHMCSVSNFQSNECGIIYKRIIQLFKYSLLMDYFGQWMIFEISLVCFLSGSTNS